MSSNRQHGFTLVEMIVAMVIIGVGLAGVIGVLSRASANSADPMVAKQMTAIAEGMLEEIQLKPFAAGPGAPSGTCDRTAFDDIHDYNGYSQNVCDVDGTTGPAGYTVAVAVTQGSGAITTNIPAADTAIITVTVQHGGDAYTLTGWRTNFGAGQP